MDRRRFLVSTAAVFISSSPIITLAQSSPVRDINTYRGVEWRFVFHPPGSGGTIDPLQSISSYGYKFFYQGRKYGNFFLKHHFSYEDDPEPNGLLMQAVRKKAEAGIDQVIAQT